MPDANSPAAAGTDFVLTRVLAAPRLLVWKVWTEPDHLMKWFGPAGMTMPSCTMDLRPGGRFHYCLRAPDGQDMWGLWVFREIVVPERLVLINSFSDAEGRLTRHPMAPNWPLEMLSSTSFVERDGQTEVTLRWSAYNASAEERQVFDSSHASMNMGWAGTFAQLTDYLAKLQG